MGISLDSLDEKKHNKFRGDPDAYQLTLEGIKNCREAGLPFQIHTTAMNWNRDEITEIVDFAAANGAVAHYIFFLIPVGRGVYIEDTSLEVIEYERLLKTIMEKQREVSIDIKPTCAPQFTRVAKQLGTLERGKIITLIGPNGCGKSTLLKIGARLLSPQHGQVLYNGADIRSIKPK